MVVYLWSRPDYGSNKHPIVIYFPHSECGFEEALDCIMLAFHHTEIPGIIHKFMTARKQQTFDEIFDQSSKDNVSEDDAHAEYLIMIEKLFDILHITKIQDSMIEDDQVIKKLIKWAKDYAEKVLNQF